MIGDQQTGEHGSLIGDQKIVANVSVEDPEAERAEGRQEWQHLECVYVSESAWPYRCAPEPALTPERGRERGICFDLLDATNTCTLLTLQP